MANMKDFLYNIREITDMDEYEVQTEYPRLQAKDYYDPVSDYENTEMQALMF